MFRNSSLTVTGPVSRSGSVGVSPHGKFSKEKQKWQSGENMSEYVDPLKDKAVNGWVVMFAGIAAIPISVMLIQGVFRLAVMGVH